MSSRAALGPLAISEKQFLAQVIEYAALMRWEVYHPWLSVRSAAGWPDLALVRRDGEGRGRLVFAELKREGGRPTPAQRLWLDLLGSVPGVEAYCWFPSSWATLERVLAR